MNQRKTAGSAPQGHSDKPPKLYSYPKYWAECFGTAPFLPMSKEEMEKELKNILDEYSPILEGVEAEDLTKKVKKKVEESRLPKLKKLN